eukprot:scaffold12773_cov64-Phaeocystis_antarctica.AAC.6
MVATVSNRARTTAAALGLDVDAIVAQHAGQILSVKDVEDFATQRGLHVAKALEQRSPPPKHAVARARPPRPRTAVRPKPNSATQPAPQPAASSASEDPLLLDGCRIEIMWPQSKVRHTGLEPQTSRLRTPDHSPHATALQTGVAAVQAA